jgi:hypothetical protein
MDGQDIQDCWKGKEENRRRKTEYGKHTWIDRIYRKYRVAGDIGNSIHEKIIEHDYEYGNKPFSCSCSVGPADGARFS